MVNSYFEEACSSDSSDTSGIQWVDGLLGVASRGTRVFARARPIVRSDRPIVRSDQPMAHVDSRTLD